MEVLEAVRLAKQYVQDLFVLEGIDNVGLEEVEFNDSDNIWSITIGFSRPWDKIYNPIAAATGNNQYNKRSYKVVRISNDNGKVISVKNHEVES